MTFTDDDLKRFLIEYPDMKRWHRFEGGLDNRRQAIDRLFETFDYLLARLDAAEKCFQGGEDCFPHCSVWERKKCDCGMQAWRKAAGK
jgi:hypothetical protein